MKAIAFIPQVPKSLRIVERDEPRIEAANEIKLRVLEVGICGTDREEAAGMRADAPPGRNDLVIGHEMFGKVVEVGSDVKAVREGDYATFTVRRGCDRCPPCRTSRSDMCSSGGYTERGIKAADGYQTEFVVDGEDYVVRIPDALGAIGVLAEPLSIVEKAIDEAVTLQTARLPYVGNDSEWLASGQALVAGLGPVGLLAAIALRARGARVIGMDVVDEASARPALLKRLGGIYADARQTPARNLAAIFGQIDLIVEATGAASVEFDLFSTLGANGVYVITGIPGGSKPITVDGATLVRQLVLQNQLVIGSVNAAKKHFQMAVADMEKAEKLWGPVVREIITHRFPYARFEQALLEHDPSEIKAVIDWS
jgi:threonine dehydrogenase-like Zn-dependent dehydrogenase